MNRMSDEAMDQIISDDPPELYGGDIPYLAPGTPAVDLQPYYRDRAAGYTREVTISDPTSLYDVRVGEPLGQGLYQDWTVLEARPTVASGLEAVVLVVRDHRYHPFVTERIGWRDDGAFIVWSGTYHETLDEALAEFRSRTATVREDRPAIEIYGTAEHEAWLIEMERQEG